MKIEVLADADSVARKVIAGNVSGSSDHLGADARNSVRL